MLAYLAHSDGSPSSTIVLDAACLPATDRELERRLGRLHAALHARRGASLISKYALIRPSHHPMFDLDYRFAQLIPGPKPAFDFHGSCGHSILASIAVASTWGWVPGLSPGMRVRVRVLNNSDQLVCEVEQAAGQSMTCTAHFIQPPATKLRSLLLTGEPLTTLTTPHGAVQVSLVSAGNPYVFVDAGACGITSPQQLFTAGDELLARLEAIRAAAIQHLGWDPRSVFPKIAAAGAFGPGQLAARAISVPSWHPTLALTGAACLSAAAAIPGTVISRLARLARCDIARLRIETPGGSTTVGCALSGPQLDDVLHYVSVSNKRAHVIGPLDHSGASLERLAPYRVRGAAAALR